MILNFIQLSIFDIYSVYFSDSNVYIINLSLSCLIFESFGSAKQLKGMSPCISILFHALPACKTVEFISFLQVYVDALVKNAYENWNQVIEYDGKSLLNFKQVRRSARNEPQTGSLSYANSIDHQPQLPRLPVPVSSEQPSADPSFSVGGIIPKF